MCYLFLMMTVEDIEKAIAQLAPPNLINSGHGMRCLTLGGSTRGSIVTLGLANWIGWRTKRSRNTAQAARASYEALCQSRLLGSL